MEELIKHDKQGFLNINEVARILRISRMTVLKFINDGLLPRVKLGRRVVIHVGDLLKFLDERHETLRPTKEGTIK